MRTLGLTGGIGMGKSAAAALLRQRQIPVLDTDELARDIVRPGEPALEEIGATFGRDLLDAAGALRREALAAIVFADPAARVRLEAITHPRITARWQQQLQTWRAEGCHYAVVVIPLLFETKVEGFFDAVICVACSPATQFARLRQRGWTDEQIDQRVAAQLPVAEKLARAQFGIWTEGDLESTAAQLARIIPD